MNRAAFLLGIAGQIADTTMELREALDVHHGDGDQAAEDPRALEVWESAEPETRAALLLSFAWHARGFEVANPADEELGHRKWVGEYTGDLLEYARAHQGDSESFHGKAFPAMPLPGQAGALASSLGFDRDDTAISLNVVLRLMAALPTGAEEAGTA